MCNRCSNCSNYSNYSNYNNGGTQYANRFSNGNNYCPRNLSGCRNALQQLSNEAARAANMVDFISNNDYPNSGCYQPRCRCCCNCCCNHRWPRY